MSQPPRTTARTELCWLVAVVVLTVAVSVAGLVLFLGRLRAL